MTQATVRTVVRTGLAVLFVAAGALVAPSAAQAGGGGCHGRVVTSGSGETVEMALNCFGPNVLYVEPGATVAWKNLDQVGHAVTGAAGAFGTYDVVPAGGTVSAIFDEPGVFPYFCFLHPSMVGAVVVGDESAPTAFREAGVSEDAEPTTSGLRFAPALLFGLAGLMVGAAGMSVGPRLMRRD